jgi:hypothetical protein
MPSKALLRPTQALAAVGKLPGAAATVTGEVDVAAVLRGAHLVALDGLRQRLPAR